MNETHPANAATDLESLVSQLWQIPTLSGIPHGLQATLAFHLESRTGQGSGRELGFFLPAAAARAVPGSWEVPDR